MRNRLMTIGLAVVVAGVSASCSQDTGVPDPDEAARGVLQVEQSLDRAGLANKPGMALQVTNGSAAASRESSEGPLVNKAGAVVGTIGQPDQPAGW